MSRAIKFRAYQKTPSLNHKPSLYEVTGLDFYEGDYGGGEVCLKNKKGEQWTEYIKDVVLEQYTGLKDKNGKEIYEGDILGGMFEGCYVGWCDTIKSFELFNCYEHYCMACDGDILWCELSDSDIDLEVIGNIHETPELLGGEE